VRERERESIPGDSICKLYVTWTRERVSWEMVLHSFAHFAALAQYKYAFRRTHEEGVKKKMEKWIPGDSTCKIYAT